GKSETTVMDDIAVFEKYGVTPKQMIEVKALMGDTSDNIPGVAGVGEKTALGLIQHFKTLDGVYENIDNDFIKKGAREKLINDKETAYLSRKLAEICLNAPIDKNWDLFIRKSADRQKAKNTFATLEMYSMIEKYSLNDAENGEITFFDEPKEDLPQKCVNLLEKSDFKKVYIYVEDNAFIVVENDGVYKANADNKALLELFKNNECEIFAFDAKPIYRLALSKGFSAKNIVFDGKLAAYLLNPSASEYSLVRLAGEYGIKKEYNCDSEAAPYVISLFETLQKNCETSEVDGLLKDIELPLCGVLAQMEHTGVAVDKEGIKNFGEAVHLTLENELAEIYSLVGYKFNVNSPKQLGEALFVKLGLPTRKKNKSGYSTNAETLESLRDLHPAVDHILNYRIYQKLYSTYIEGLLKEVAE
ncbi:MAG: DNA polymerase, partial [Oscillospiraceae bacterium]